MSVVGRASLERSSAKGVVKAVLGPTNTGKTHLAVERMLAHSSGMIGAPLRLLAREIYDRVVREKGVHAAALVTGEEKIAPESARYFICTAEAMPVTREVAFLAVDEIQVARDPDRGHVFTERLLNARGSAETMLLGAETMRPMLRRLLPGAETIRRERMSRLSYGGPMKLTKLAKRSAIVAFSAEEVYAIAELMRRHRGGAAVVMGALSPRTRNAQVALYQSGEVDFLVATDAIGMGLNMDIEHVAFASRAKFDGVRQRRLYADEIAQIAGRAGRAARDGTFGETGDCAPFEAELVERIEAHEFEAADHIWWRNSTLSFESTAGLLASLAEAPSLPGLRRVRTAEDEETLKALGADAAVMERVTSPAAVARLWDACQLPDFRKASLEEHARLVGRIASHLLSAHGRISEEWIARDLEKLDRTTGDMDTLQARLAHVRTWAYCANRADWLADPGHWRGRAREIEDRLSDALHEALTQRFIDRRTSALLKGLKREDALRADVSADGAVTVEGHLVGRLTGLEFTLDMHAGGLEGRALRNAALRALAPEVSRRLGAIARGEAGALHLELDGRITADGAPAAMLVKGPRLLAPGIALAGGEEAGETARAAARARILAWVEAGVAKELGAVLALEAAWRGGMLAGPARGLAFQLLELGGAVKREDAPVANLSREARAQLRALGVRIGRHTIYLPALIKPGPARLMAILTACAAGACGPGASGDGLFLPAPGAISTRMTGELGWRTAAAAGYRALGPAAVRFDRVEMLAAALMREAQPSDEDLARLIGRPLRELADILRALGYRRAKAADTESTSRWRAPRPAKERAAKGPVHPAFAELAALVPAPARGRNAKKARA